MSSSQLPARRPELVLYGAGGLAREICWLAESSNDSGVVMAMIDDDPAQHSTTVNDILVLGLDAARERFPHALMVMAIGSPQVREAAAARAAAAGFAFGTLIHSRVERSRRVEMGEGVVICAGSILTTNIILGRHVQINLHCTVGHDVVMGDFATLAPGVNVSGRVHIGARAYIGTNASIINGHPGVPLLIGDDAVVGAAACVTRNVLARTTVVGIPARPLP